MSLALEQPRLEPVQPWGCLEHEAFLGLSGTSPKRLRAPSLIVDFRGSPGIRALYQAIGIPNLNKVCKTCRLQCGPGPKSKQDSFGICSSGAFQPSGDSLRGEKLGHMHRGIADGAL